MKNDTREENERRASSSRTVNHILTGDALTMLKTLPDGIVQTCVTSPPYYGLRDYGVEGQIGLEETPEEFIDKLVQVFREVRRVLRHDGTLWLNLGDSYAGGGVHSTGRNDENATDLERRAALYQTGRVKATTTPQLRSIIKVNHGLKPKDLIGIPWMVAFALRADGWYLRSDIIWNKPTAMPESVTDRPTKAHEYLFLLSKNERYYYDQEAIAEPASPTSTGNRRIFRGGGTYTGRRSFFNSTPQQNLIPGNEANPAGSRNKRTVWTVASQPYSEAHFATFPPKLIEPCILAGTSPRACEHCGSPWQRVTETTGGTWEARKAAGSPMRVGLQGVKGVDRTNTLGSLGGSVSHHLGWQPTCTCSNEGTGKCIVLDPFMGAGTVALVAIQHGRHYLGVELNPTYVALAEKRIAHVQQNLWSTASFDEVAV